MHNILHYHEKKYVRHGCATAVFLTHFRSIIRMLKILMQQKRVDQDRKFKFHDFSMTLAIFPKFHDFSRPGKCYFKFHDFSWLFMTVWTLETILGKVKQLKSTNKNSWKIVIDARKLDVFIDCILVLVWMPRF